MKELQQQKRQLGTGVIAVICSRLRLIHEHLAVREHDSAVFGLVWPPRLRIFRTNPAGRFPANRGRIVVTASAHEIVAAVMQLEHSASDARPAPIERGIAQHPHVRVAGTG